MTASAMAQMVAGTFGPAGYCASFRAAKIAAAISSERLRPSSIPAGYHIRFSFAKQHALQNATSVLRFFSVVAGAGSS